MGVGLDFSKFTFSKNPTVLYHRDQSCCVLWVFGLEMTKEGNYCVSRNSTMREKMAEKLFFVSALFFYSLFFSILPYRKDFLSDTGKGEILALRGTGMIFRGIGRKLDMAHSATDDFI